MGGLDYIAEPLRHMAVPIGELTFDPANARLHDEANMSSIKGSLRQFGQRQPLIVQRQGMIVRAGNGRLKAAIELGWTHVAVLIVDEDNVSAVAFAISDNRTAELAEWDDAVLERLLREVEVGDPDLQQMMADLAQDQGLLFGDDGGDETEEAPEAEIDRAEELREKWGTATGQLWLIHGKAGTHRLLCGDSTKGEDVARLMDGEKAVLMNTDPPYGISYDVQANYDAANATDGTSRVSQYKPIENDELTGEELQGFVESVIRVAVPHLEPNAAFYLWHPMLTQGTFFAAAAAAAADILIHRQIIWVKPHFIFGRGDYHWKHELCFYGWIKGNRPPWYGERNQDTVWNFSIGEHKSHPSQKPLELFAVPMRNHSRPGEAVYEPFCGSGSQLLAAEQLGRTCYGMEISPAYVGVILERCEQAGMRPELEGA